MRSIYYSGVLISVVLLIFLGCTDSKVGPLEEKISALESKVSLLEESIQEMGSDLASLQAKDEAYKSVYLNTSSKGFERLDTSLGSFLVSINDIKPYSNGYKLILNVGNPYSARFSGLKVNIKWGTAFDRKGSKGVPGAFLSWRKSLKEKEESLTNDLRPGTWNIVTLILSPAKAEELGHIELSMSVDQIALIQRK